MTDSEITAGKLLLLEYGELKQEQKGRIAFRDSLLYATLASMAGVIAAALQSGGRPELLLLLPAVSLVLGWAYLVNDVKVSAIGQYIRDELTPRLASMVPDQSNVFEWERTHRTDRRRGSRKALQLAVDLLLFAGAPLIALIVFWVQTPPDATLLAVSVVEAVAVAVLAVQVVMYADLST